MGRDPVIFLQLIYSNRVSYVRVKRGTKMLPLKAGSYLYDVLIRKQLGLGMGEGILYDLLFLWGQAYFSCDIRVEFPGG